MDAKEDSYHQTSPPPHPGASSPPPSKQLFVYTYPQIKKKKSPGTRLKIQIRRSPVETPPPPPPPAAVEPEPTTQVASLESLGKSRSSRQRKPVVHESFDGPETKSSAMERAEEIKDSLDPSFPSFAKALVRSNVTVGFWMHLPMRFCKTHLPTNDTTILLENESGQEFITNYIADRTALSGGWKAFIGANSLLEGDVLIFHLVKPLRFKVYVARGSDSANADAVPDPDTHEKEDNTVEDLDDKDMESHKDIKDSELFPVTILQENGHGLGEKGMESHEEAMELPLPVGICEENTEDTTLMELDSGKRRQEVHSQNENEDAVARTMEIVRSSGSIDLNDLENFSICVNGSAIDSELSDHHRTKYYELCCSQKSYLHENLLNSINYKLAAEIIIGTVNISEAIRACKLSSSGADYAVWDKNLKGFELLGMNVGFLRDRLKQLMSLAVEMEEAMESDRIQLEKEQARIKEEMNGLELQLLELQSSRERLSAEIEGLKAPAERHESVFQEAVNVPW